MCEERNEATDGCGGHELKNKGKIRSKKEEKLKTGVKSTFKLLVNGAFSCS